MKKDKTIIDLIARLKTKINFNLVELVDYWEADLCAIGIKKENKLIYISTFSQAENNQKGIDFDLEITEDISSKRLNVIKEMRNASELELIKESKQFLDI